MDYAELCIGNNKFTLVDMEELKMVVKYRWHITGNGYVQARVGGEKKSLHRILMSDKLSEGMCVDHINGDRLDNRKSNLRVCTHTENKQNQKMHRDTKSGFKGVCKQINRWKASIGKDRKVFYIGSYKCPIEAAKAYDQKAKEFFGEFAKLNFPD